MELHYFQLNAANDSKLFESSANDVQKVTENLSKFHNQRVFKFDSVSLKKNSKFQDLIEIFLAKERVRLNGKEITNQTLEMIKCRANGHLREFFLDHELNSISFQKINEFVKHLNLIGVGNVTINQYLGLLKRILSLGVIEGLLSNLPTFPKVKSKSAPRGSFSIKEYLKLLKTSKALGNVFEQDCIQAKITHRNKAGSIYINSTGVLKEMTWLIGFMTNTFLRPVDIKLIQHKHIQIIEDSYRYLRISMPETKRHTGQVVSMRAAVGIYKRLLAYQSGLGFGKPDDFLFIPQLKDRNGAIALISGQFKKILDFEKMLVGSKGEKRTLYSLRHTAITYRLLYGRGIDLLTLARNARTSVEMIEKFYSSNLTAEMNIELLQSKRTSYIKT